MSEMPAEPNAINHRFDICGAVRESAKIYIKVISHES